MYLLGPYNIGMRIIVMAHNIRSIHNVGSLLRTAECMGIQHVYISGYTPYPRVHNDTRLPHERDRIHNQIHKTALGAESLLTIHRFETLAEAIASVRQQNIHIAGLEQHAGAIPLPSFKPDYDTALLVGNEVDGLDLADIDLCDEIIEIPMLGKKESLNVVQAAAMACYQATFWKNVVK